MCLVGVCGSCWWEGTVVMPKGRKLSRLDQSCSETEGKLGVWVSVEGTWVVSCDKFVMIGLEWARGLKLIRESSARSDRWRL